MIKRLLVLISLSVTPPLDRKYYTRRYAGYLHLYLICCLFLIFIITIIAKAAPRITIITPIPPTTAPAMTPPDNFAGSENNQYITLNTTCFNLYQP